MLECDVFVVGCGPAGASLAWYLSQKNIKVIVAEKKKTLDIPVRCAGLVPVNIAGLFDFKIAGINNRTEYLETYSAKNPSEKFYLISKTSAPGFILDRDVFVNDIASRFTSAGCKLLKGTKVITARQGPDGFILDLVDIASKNHFIAKAKIIVGADGPLSLIGRLIGSANKSFMPAILQNPSVIPKSTDCSKVFFSPYIPCGYGWLFPKAGSVNLGIGASLERKKMWAGNKAKNKFLDSVNSSFATDPGNSCSSKDLGTSSIGKGSVCSNLCEGSACSSLGLDTGIADVPLKNILAAFIRHLEFSGIFAGSISPYPPVFNNISSMKDNNNKDYNICQLLPSENKYSAKQDKSLKTYNQFAPAVTGLIPDSGIVENPCTKNGIILCGDAAGLCNPVTGAGIYNAIYSARLVSEIITESLILNDLNILQEIKEIYNSRFGNSINRALRKKLLQKNNWPNLTPDMTTRNSFDNNDTIKFSDLIRQTWISFREYWH